MGQFIKRFLQILCISFASLSWAKDVKYATLGQTGTYKLQAADKEEVVSITIVLHPPQTRHKALDIGGYNALKSLKVEVSNKQLFVPLGCTYRLDIDRVFLEGKAGDWHLIFEGGDGSESYEYLIRFSANELEGCHYEVKKRRPWIAGYPERYKRATKTKN